MKSFWNKIRTLVVLAVFTVLLSACQETAQAESVPTVTGESMVVATIDTTETIEPTVEQPDLEADEATETSEPEETETPTEEPPTATPDVRLDPEDWRNWPVVPSISAHAIELYQQAVANGADPTHFSKIGDCQNVTSYFLADFDRGRYRLGEEYAYLQETIDYYAGSWKRESLAVQGGFNVASVMSPLRADPTVCETDESPVECEFRLHRPSIVIISMETWWNHDDPSKYEFYMRHLLDTVLELGALPILATKADNLEGDHTINRSIAQLAYEYDIPMWNFWAATDPLPNYGLVETTVVDGETVDDNFHLTIGLGNYFDDPDNKVAAWPVRNLTALQTIHAVYEAVKGGD
ncbi:MAG: hypothetical protein V2J07_08615 [Anaerolineae bacterium]|nr:hypothetical protein [Anaerolineae bacterium]